MIFTTTIESGRPTYSNFYSNTCGPAISDLRIWVPRLSKNDSVPHNLIGKLIFVAHSALHIDIGNPAAGPTE